MIDRSTDIQAALAARRRGLPLRRDQRGFFTLPGGMGAAKPAGGAAPSTTTWNPSETAGTLSNGNLTVTYAGGVATRATSGVLAAKGYAEILIVSMPGGCYVGVSRADIAYNSSAGSLLVRSNNTGFTGGSTGATGMNAAGTLAAGDVIMIAIDTTSGTAANRKIWVGRNSVWSIGDPATGTGGNANSLSDAVAWLPQIWYDGGSTGQFTLNCGATAFTYTPPAGFSAM